MNRIDRLYMEMIRYYQGDPKHIQHFVKVHSFFKADRTGRGTGRRYNVYTGSCSPCS